MRPLRRGCGSRHPPADDRQVILLERYASRDAFAAHREAPHFKDLVLEQIAPRLDNRVIETFDALE